MNRGSESECHRECHRERVSERVTEREYQREHQRERVTECDRKAGVGVLVVIGWCNAGSVTARHLCFGFNLRILV